MGEKGPDNKTGDQKEIYRRQWQGEDTGMSPGHADMEAGNIKDTDFSR